MSFGQVGDHLAALGERPGEGEHVGRQHGLTGLDDRVHLGFEVAQPVLVRGGVLEWMVVAVHANVCRTR
jgi:hypothetical protein